jgi:hypothetical protein
MTDQRLNAQVEWNYREKYPSAADRNIARADKKNPRSTSIDLGFDDNGQKTEN